MRAGSWRPLCGLLCAVLLVALPARGVMLEGAAFPAMLRSRGADLELHRAALLRWLGLFKVYVGALYIEPGGDPARVLEDVPKRLEIQYLRGFSATDFVKATNTKVAQNVDVETLGRLRARLDRLNALYRDVEEGDRYALTYLPGQGTELSYNGRPLGRVEGADLAAALFSIWLGRAPVDEGFKRELLGET